MAKAASTHLSFAHLFPSLTFKFTLYFRHHSLDLRSATGWRHRLPGTNRETQIVSEYNLSLDGVCQPTPPCINDDSIDSIGVRNEEAILPSRGPRENFFNILSQLIAPIIVLRWRAIFVESFLILASLLLAFFERHWMLLSLLHEHG
jgi:hypothetical protein